VGRSWGVVLYFETEKAVGLSVCYIAVLTGSSNIRLLTLDKHFDVLKKEIELKLYDL